MRVIIQRTKRCSHEVNFVIQVPLTYSLIYGHQKTLSPKFDDEKKRQSIKARYFVLNKKKGDNEVNHYPLIYCFNFFNFVMSLKSHYALACKY
jgi:hypothetical protein